MTNRASARAAGLKVGAYHFGNPDSAANDALNEARWFLQNATIASGDLVPVLDLEVTNGLSAAALTTWAQIWLTEVELVTGVRPLIYTTPELLGGLHGEHRLVRAERIPALGRPLDERVAADGPGRQLGRDWLDVLAALIHRQRAGDQRTS